MRKFRVCVPVLAVAGSGIWFAMPQVPASKEIPKKESAAKSAEQKPAREIYGKIQSLKGTLVTLQTRTGNIVQVDAKPAMEAQRSVPLVVGRAVAVKGTVDKAGILHAEILQRAKDSSILWPADR
jgi:hypothetical protein